MAGRDYGSWNLIELKRELEKRGAKRTGKKADLVKRLMYYDQNNNFGKRVVQEDEHSFQISTPEKAAYKDINADTQFPNVTSQAVESYLAAYGKAIDVKIQNLYQERFLLYLRAASDEEDKFYALGSCAAEMKKSVCYGIDVVLDKHGSVLECQCECAVGTGPGAHCKHVMCLLFALISFSKNKKVLTRETCTQRLQTFHKCQPFRGSPIKAEDLKVRLDGQGKDLQHLVKHDVRPAEYAQLDSYHSFFGSMCINYQAVHIDESSSPMPVLQSMPPANIYALSNDHYYLRASPEDNFLKAIRVLDVSEEEISEIEKETRGQGKNKYWHMERKKRLSSSNFGRICKCTSKTDKKALARSYLNPRKIITRAIQHGRTFEDQAVKRYEEEQAITTQPCGIFVSFSHPFLSSTPDRIINQTTVLEVKCPYTSRDQFITEVTVPYLEMVDGQLTLKPTHDYYYQVQGQMFCTGRQTCYFVVFTFKDMKIVKIDRNEQFIHSMVKSLTQFYNDYLRDELLRKLFYRNTDKYTFMQ